MITQELIDYVKTQLSSGVAREKITFYLLGQGDWTMEQINEAFTSATSISGGPNNNLNLGVRDNKYWSKWIPGTNKIFMLFSFLVMFVVNPFIIVTDALEIGTGTALFFYGIMFIPLVIFGIFYRYENNKLSNQFGNTRSGTDPLFLILVVIRNIVFGLNFVPIIQITGAGALVFGIIPYLLIYIFLVRFRNKSVVAV
jgi:hypothetical protein